MKKNMVFVAKSRRIERDGKAVLQKKVGRKWVDFVKKDTGGVVGNNEQSG